MQLVNCFRLIDESPRWLWSQGRISEAVDIVDRAVKLNGGEPIDKAHYVSRGKSTLASAEEQSYSVLDMFRTPKLRMKSLNVCLNWFVIYLIYICFFILISQLHSVALFLSSSTPRPTFTLVKFKL